MKNRTGREVEVPRLGVWAADVRSANYTHARSAKAACAAFADLAWAYGLNK